jgi:hypothetical protein
MPHILEPAKTGRAKCRGCGQPIAAGLMRFGERVPNPFADEEGGETTHWMHVPCAAYMRPDPFLQLLAETSPTIEHRDALERDARLGLTYRRLSRATTVARAPSGRAVCRHCKETILKDAWRIALMYYEEGRFAPSGFIHLTCAAPYLETTDLIGRLKHFSPELKDADWVEVRAQLGIS